MLAIKKYVPRGMENRNGTVRGSWIFDQFDEACATYIDEHINLKDTFLVTNYSEIRFKNLLQLQGTIEVFCKCVKITVARIDIHVTMYHKIPFETDKLLIADGNVSFTVLDKDWKILRIPKETIQHIKTEEGL